MKLRTRLDVFSAALFSALGLSQVTACGGSAVMVGGPGNAGASAGGGSNADNGGAASGGHGHAGSGGSENMGNRYPCRNPSEQGNGIVACDGFHHRQAIATCASKLPRAEPYPNAPVDAQCHFDADCTAMVHGFCAGGGQAPGPYCTYGCIEDSECGAGSLCECGDPVGACVSATCSSDADCQAGFLCKSFDQSRGCGQTQYTCQSAADTCGSDADCGSNVGSTCWYDPNLKHFACASNGCIVGRPFLVQGVERLAPAVRRSDWRELALGLRVAELPGALPARLAREWTRMALMEHASIAAFARFTLQLLSLGAPPELIERATVAMADETKHAKACFALASSYAGEPVGPGPLAVEHSLDQISLGQIVLTTIREGCVGETVAAIEAREAAEHASDPCVRALLLMISEDETRHAELAFQFLKWALSGGDAALHATVSEEFDAIQRESETRPSGLNLVERDLLQNGVVPQPLRDAIRAGAIADVILPCARALLAAGPVSLAESAFSSVASGARPFEMGRSRARISSLQG